MFLPTILAGVIRNKLPGFPGTAPLMRRARISLSTFTISSLRILVRPPPSRPGIFFPGYTRPGVVPAPMEPSCLWLFDPWLIGPLAKFHLLIPPAKHTEQFQITMSIHFPSTTMPFLHPIKTPGCNLDYKLSLVWRLLYKLDNLVLKR